MAYRGIAPVPFDRARQCASNGPTSSIFFTIFLLSPRLAGTTFLRAQQALLGTTHDADLSSWGRRVTVGVGYSMYERASEDQEKRDQIGNGKGLIIINNQPF